MKAVRPFHADELPTLAAIVDTFAYHVGEIMSYRPGATSTSRAPVVGFGIGYGPGCPTALVYVRIRAAEGTPEAEGGPWGPWAQCEVGPSKDGPWRVVGNRHGARMAYSEACAPVLAWVAAHEARVPSSVVAPLAKVGT